MRKLYQFRRLTMGWLALPAALWLAGPAQAQDQAAAPPGAAAARGGPQDADKKKPRFPEFSDVTKDLKPMEGLFTLYRPDPDDKSADPEKLLAKIPAKLLNEDLLFATSIASGGNFTGWMWSDYLFRWEVAGDQLKMVVPDTRFIADDGKPVADAIKRTYGASYIASLPIVTMTPGGDVVVDFGRLLKSDIAGVAFLGGRVTPELSTWTKVKAFPDNLLIEANLALSRGQGGQTVGISYAFQRLPKLGSYKPREADPRLGYFMTTRVDWAKPNSEREVAERYINRWNLEKRDPSLELSPPKKPITFIIEKTVPIQWRRWVREGIESWNEAFEKIGFVDAIVVQQQTDDNEYADYDPEDARYNFIRWTVTGRALAVGPSRADPRTGQILDADIVMDDAWVRYFVTNVDLLVPRAAREMHGPGFDLLLEQYPDFVPELLRPTGEEPPDPLEVHRDALADQPCSLHMRDGYACTYAEGMTEQLALVHYAMVAAGSGKKIPERLIGEAIKEVVAHEVGHTLGLRHNFKASSWLSLDEVKRRRNETDEATVSSVMDYNPLLIFAEDDLEKVRHFITPRIGPYDHWVIEYGYKVPGKDDKGEKEMLKSIASRCTENGLDYATDEDTMGLYSPDPMVNRYDMSSDPVAWATTRVELVDKLAADILDWAANEGEPRYYITQAFNTLLSQRGRNFNYVSRLVGGQLFHRDHKGDPNARPAFVLVDAASQRAAVRMLTESLFTEEFCRPDAQVLNNLAPSRWSDWFDSGPTRLDYPIHDRITSMQVSSLMTLIAPPVLQRVYDAELKCTTADKFTAAELLTSVRDAVWSQLDKIQGGREYTDAQPLIGSISRNLQREYLNMMLALAQYETGRGMSADLTSMIRYALRELSDKIGRTLDGAGKAKLDFATRAHLSESKSRIDRVLEARYIAN